MAISSDDRTDPGIGKRGYRERTVERRTGFGGLFGPGMILGVAGATALVVSMFLPWRTGSLYPSDVPVAFLWDHDTTSSWPSLLIVLIPVAVALILGAIAPLGGSGLRLLSAVVGLAVVTLFAWQTYRGLDAFPGSELEDVLDTGFVVAAIGGVLAVMSGFFADSLVGWNRRVVDRELVRDDAPID
jgi:hypothetical protein